MTSSLSFCDSALDLGDTPARFLMLCEKEDMMDVKREARGEDDAEKEGATVIKARQAGMR